MLTVRNFMKDLIAPLVLVHLMIASEIIVKKCMANTAPLSISPTLYLLSLLKIKAPISINYKQLQNQYTLTMSKKNQMYSCI